MPESGRLREGGLDIGAVWRNHRRMGLVAVAAVAAVAAAAVVAAVAVMVTAVVQW